MPDLYQEWTKGAITGIQSQAMPEVSLAVRGVALVSAVQELVQGSGVSVVVADTLSDRAVTVELDRVPLQVALGCLARHVGADIARQGQVYFLGPRRPEDRGALVKVVPRAAATELKQMIQALLGQGGRSQVSADGLVVVSDRVEVLARVSEALDMVASAPYGTWVCQFYSSSCRRMMSGISGLG